MMLSTSAKKDDATSSIAAVKFVIASLSPNCACWQAVMGLLRSRHRSPSHPRSGSRPRPMLRASRLDQPSSSNCVRLSS